MSTTPKPSPVAIIPRLAIRYGLVLTAVLLVGGAGIGYLVTRYRTILDSPHVFAAIVTILALSVVFDVAARRLERRTFAWQTAGRRERGSARAEPVGMPAPAPV